MLYRPFYTFLCCKEYKVFDYFLSWHTFKTERVFVLQAAPPPLLPARSSRIRRLLTTSIGCPISQRSTRTPEACGRRCRRGIPCTRCTFLLSLFALLDYSRYCLHYSLYLSLESTDSAICWGSISKDSQRRPRRRCMLVQTRDRYVF
jgi:hypothetical protein